MLQRIIQIDNEIECLHVQQILESSDIPVTPIQKQVASFPQLNLQSHLFHLIIPEEFSAQYFRLITNDYPTQIIQDTADGEKSKSKLKRGLLIVYAVVISLGFLKYYSVSRKISESKNFEFAWSTFNTEFRMIDKKSQQVVTTFIDKNFDLNSERIDNYVDQINVAESYDRDENGIYELTVYYDQNGDVSSQSVDENQNGWVEREEYVLENQEVLILVDEDENGRYSILSN